MKTILFVCKPTATVQLSLAAALAIAIIGCRRVATNDIPLELPGDALERHASTRFLPEYPSEARQAGQGGTVAARVLVSPVGTVQDIHVLESPALLLTVAVKRALMRWQFTPFVPPSSKAGPVEGTLLFNFNPATGQVLDLLEAPAGISLSRSGSLGEQPITLQSSRELLREFPDLILIDIRDRRAFRTGHDPKAINLPSREIRDRVHNEFRRSDTVLVDCYPDMFEQCGSAVKELKRFGVHNVIVRNRN